MTSNSSAPPDAGGPTLLRVIIPLLRYHRAVTGIAGGTVVLSAAITLAGARQYTARASFVPQQAESSSGLASLAAQFGVSAPGGASAESPNFYGDLLRSRRILGNAVDSPYVSMTKRGIPLLSRPHEVSGDLVAVFESKGGTAAQKREDAIRQLNEQINVTVGQGVGLVRLAVTTHSPALSARIAQLMLDLVSDFNTSARQSRASAERRFSETRLQAAQEELRESENRIQTFTERNRGDLSQSPALTLERDRLQREVFMRQQIVNSLAQSYEQARISEVRNTPVITVVERPEVPARADSRMLALKGLLALVVGLALGGLYAFARDTMGRSSKHEPDDYAEFVALLDQFRTDMRNRVAFIRSRGAQPRA